MLGYTVHQWDSFIGDYWSGCLDNETWTSRLSNCPRPDKEFHCLYVSALAGSQTWASCLSNSPCPDMEFHCLYKMYVSALAGSQTCIYITAAVLKAGYPGILLIL